MSILIKGMEMQKNCFECPWRCKVDPENMLCRISGEYFEETFSGTIQDRHKSCPLVPVPPHGRLIDADALADVFRSFIAMYDSCPFSQLSLPDKARRDELQSALAEVINALTIIEAEEGEA